MTTIEYTGASPRMNRTLNQARHPFEMIETGRSGTVHRITGCPWALCNGL